MKKKSARDLQCIIPFLYGASLCGLRKKDGGGIRPIAIGSVIRRLVAKLGCRAVKGEMAAFLQPHQLGFGVPLGCEAAIHATRAFALSKADAGDVIVKVDLHNAFNSVERDSMLSVIKEKVPVLYPYRVALSNKWVYKIKKKVDGSIERFKARLVIRGCNQEHGIDYHETFSPVVRWDTIRTMLSEAVTRKMHMTQFDVKTAFLYDDIDEVIYMKQPVGFDDGSGRVCKLIKSLYGLKQAPRCWNKKFCNFLSKYK